MEQDSAGTNYFATNGTLNFGPGINSHDFGVNIINDHVITNDHTVILSLSDPQGGAVLGSPSTAVLDIVEGNGSYIIAAGTQLVSGGSSGVINPGATVTVDFALRCIAGGDTTNLVATMQTNNSSAPRCPIPELQ